MDKELFDDLLESCKEVLEFKKGNTQLKTTIIEIPDEEIEVEQMISQQVVKLSMENKHKVMQYASELLQASSS